MLSVSTTGAMASKKCRRLLPRRLKMSSASASLASGPAATRVGQSPSRLLTSSRWSVMFADSAILRSTDSLKMSRLTVSESPAGTAASRAHSSKKLPSIVSSCFKSPCALVTPKALKLLEQTSCAKCPSLWAGVMRLGRISYKSTLKPRLANCKAASQPARPPPITRTRSFISSSPSCGSSSRCQSRA